MVFIILLSAILVLPVFAQEDEQPSSFFVYNWNIGNIGVGLNIPMNNIYRSEIVFSFLHFGIEQKNSRIGIEFNPLTIYLWRTENEDDELKPHFSLLNFKAHWNILDINGFYVGPFAAISYFFIHNDILWDKYVFTAGLHIGFKIKYRYMNYNIINGEIGYRNINGISRYYISGKLDLLTFYLLYSILNQDHHHYYYFPRSRRRR